MNPSPCNPCLPSTVRIGLQLLAIVISLVWSVAYGEPAGKAMMSTGQVTVIREGKTIALTNGNPIEPGDRIITGANSAVHILLTDGSQIALDSQSELRVQAYVYNKNATDTSHLVIARGTVRLTTGSMTNDRVRFETPMADVRIQSTSTLQIVVGNKDTAVIVQKGDVKVNGEQARLNQPLASTQANKKPVQVNETNLKPPNAQARSIPATKEFLSPNDKIVDDLGNVWSISDRLIKRLDGSLQSTLFAVSADTDPTSGKPILRVAAVLGKAGSYQLFPTNEIGLQIISEKAFGHVTKILPADERLDLGDTSDLFDKIPDLGVDTRSLRNNTNAPLVGENPVGTGWGANAQPSQPDGFQKAEDDLEEFLNGGPINNNQASAFPTFYQFTPPASPVQAASSLFSLTTPPAGSGGSNNGGGTTGGTTGGTAGGTTGGTSGGTTGGTTNQGTFVVGTAYAESRNNTSVATNLIESTAASNVATNGGLATGFTLSGGAYTGTLSGSNLVAQTFAAFNGAVQDNTGATVSINGIPTTPPSGLQIFFGAPASEAVVFAQTSPSVLFSRVGGSMPGNAAGEKATFITESLQINFAGRSGTYNANWGMPGGNLYFISNMPVSIQAQSGQTPLITGQMSNSINATCTKCSASGTSAPLTNVTLQGAFLGTATPISNLGAVVTTNALNLPANKGATAHAVIMSCGTSC